jgi:tetratricopeptide (TPR) repeat protein
LFFPIALSWDYSFPYFPIISVFDPKILIFTLLVLASISWSIYAVIAQKNRIAFGLLFFIITFSIVSNFFILIGATLGERFLFLPSLGFSILLVFLLNLLFKNIGVKATELKKYLAYTIVCISLLFSIKTVDRNADWESNRTLFEAGYFDTPTSSRSVMAYASHFRELGEQSVDINYKVANFNKAIELYNESINLYDQVSDSWYNLGICYSGLNNIELTVYAYNKALEIDSSNINANNNLGVIYFQQNNYELAKKYFLNCLAINKQFGSALANLGAVNHNQGNLDEARKYYEQALRVNPNDQNTRRNLSKL